MPDVRRQLVALAALSVLSGIARAAPQVTGSAVGTAAPSVVYRGDQLVPFLTAMQTRRVDIAGIGDSNQILGGTYGHDHGQQKAWADRVGLYGTGIIPVNAYGGYQGAMGYNYGGGLGGIGRPQAEVPAAYQPYLLPFDVGFPGPALYLGPGESISANGSQVAMEVGPSSPWGVTPAMRWHLTVGTTADSAAAGSIFPSARIAGTGNILATKSASTFTGSTGLADLTLDVPADAGRTGTIWFEPTKLFEQSATGPLFATSSRVDMSAVNKGVAYSTLLYQGGRTTRDAAVVLQQSSDTALGEWMREAVRLQNVPKSDARLMVQVIQGGNDRGNATQSVGPNPAPTGTPQGFQDNLTAIRARLLMAWVAAGYDPGKLNLVVGAYHPQDFDKDRFAAFERAAMDFADSTSGVTVIRGTRMLSGATMNANGWYRTAEDGGNDLSHLSQAGYEGVGRLTINQMLSLLAEGSPARSDVSSLSLTLTDDPSAPLRPDQLSLVRAGGGPVAGADLSVDYDPTTRTATWTFPGLDGDVLPRGQYQATISVPGYATPYTFGFAAIPEPASAGLLATAATGLLARRGRRRAAA
jgi:hypothetical protein